MTSNVRPIRPAPRAPTATPAEAIAAIARYVAFPVSSPQEAANAADVLAQALGVGPGPLIVALRDMADAYDDPEQLTRLAEESDAKGRAALAEAGALQAELARSRTCARFRRVPVPNRSALAHVAAR